MVSTEDSQSYPIGTWGTPEPEGQPTPPLPKGDVLQASSSVRLEAVATSFHRWAGDRLLQGGGGTTAAAGCRRAGPAGRPWCTTRARSAPPLRPRPTRHSTSRSGRLAGQRSGLAGRHLSARRRCSAAVRHARRGNSSGQCGRRGCAGAWLLRPSCRPGVLGLRWSRVSGCRYRRGVESANPRRCPIRTSRAGPRPAWSLCGRRSALSCRPRCTSPRSRPWSRARPS